MDKDQIDYGDSISRLVTMPGCGEYPRQAQRRLGVPGYEDARFGCV